MRRVIEDWRECSSKGRGQPSNKEGVEGAVEGVEELDDDACPSLGRALFRSACVLFYPIDNL
jgi:hypothetical protein